MSTPSLHATQGALFIGTSIAGVLFGVSCLQTFFYVNNYGKDPWYLKALVAMVFVCDLLHQLMCTHSIYEYLVTNYDNPAALITIPWSLVGEVMATAILALLVQSFYAARVYRLSGRNWWLTILVGCPIIPSFVLEVVYTILFAQIPTLPELPKIAVIAQAINALNAICDILIALAMVWLLRQNRTGLRNSDNVINRLVIFVVNTGLLTSVCATLALIWLLASPNTFIYAIFFFITPRLYANSLFAALNARATIRANAMQTEPLSLAFVPAGGVDRSSTAFSQGISTTVHRGGASTTQLTVDMLADGTELDVKPQTVTRSLDGTYRLP